MAADGTQPCLWLYCQNMTGISSPIPSFFSRCYSWVCEVLILIHCLPGIWPSTLARLSRTRFPTEFRAHDWVGGRVEDFCPVRPDIQLESANGLGGIPNMFCRGVIFWPEAL